MTDTGDLPGLDLPADPDGPLVEAVLSRLLQEADPVARFAAVTALAERRLNWVRQLTVAQLQAEGLTMSQIAERLGVTKGRVGQLANPKAATGDPAYAWGRLVAATETLAYWADRPRGRRVQPTRTRHGDEHAKLQTTAFAAASGHLRSTFNEAARRWASRARPGREQQIDDLLARVGELLLESEGLPVSLSLDQRAQVVLGYHHERHEVIATQVLASTT